ncbi:hypothetical protein [Lacrimispora sp.]|nr:hypothetical protein [Lacrimispora sp.]
MRKGKMKEGSRKINPAALFKVVLYLARFQMDKWCKTSGRATIIINER